MRTPLIALALVLAPLGGSSASACAPPAEGEPQCCERPFITVEAGGHTVSVPDPFWNPAICS